MIKQLLSLTSIIFVMICVGAIFLHFIGMPDVSSWWAGAQNFIQQFDHEGALEIESTPAGASVYVDNRLIGQTPLTTKISNGAYDVKLILDGYQTFARRIVIEKRNTAVVHAKLSQDYGRLHITSTPSNAVVFLDGKRQGHLTPLEIQVVEGKYVVKVVKDKFYPFEEEVTIKQGKTMAVDANLVRQLGRIILETTPPGAQAYIGTDPIGTTPLTQDKPIGKYVITLKKPGFRDRVIEATIAPDESLPINVELAERMGGLKVITNPPGAEVHLNDVYHGESPTTIEAKPGVYQLVIRKKQYRELSEEIAIEDNITKKIDRTLDPAIGELRIDSDPPHAKVWLDSEEIGFTPIKVNKLPGIYTIRLAKPGYRNYAEQITINEGAFVQLKPVLEKE